MSKKNDSGSIKRLISKQPKFISVDLGTANTVVYVSGHGIVFNEPTILAYSARDGRILYVGKKANQMRGKTHSSILLVRPLEDGVISDIEATQDLLEYVFLKLKLREIWINAIVLLAAPSGVTELEQQALREIAHKLGAKYVFIEPEAKMAAIGSGINIDRPKGNLVVDIGGGTTDIAVLAAGDIVVGDSIKIAGNHIDVEIQKLVRNKYNIAVGLLTCEKIKKAFPGVYETPNEERIGVYGRDVSTGLPKVIGVSPKDIRKVLVEEVLPRIAGAIYELLEITPPELSADIKQTGIVLCGGGALIRGLDQYLEEHFKLPVNRATEPLLTVINGTRKYEKEIIELISSQEEDALSL